MHTIAKVLWLGVIVIVAEKSDSEHARIIQQEFHCDKFRECLKDWLKTFATERTETTEGF